MSPNEKNSNSVGTQQNQPEDSFDLNKTMQNLPNSDIANDPKKLKERITDLLKGDTEFSKMKQGDKILVVSAASGLFTAVLPLLAVGATLAIPGAIVGLALYFAVKVAVKTVQSGYKGLKWSAEKTVDGAKYTAGKVKDASTYAAGKVRDSAVYVKDKVKEGTSRALDRSGSFLKEAAHSSEYSMKSEFVQKLLEREGIKKMVNNTIEIIKANNSSVLPTIKSAIKSAIDSKAEELKGKYVVDIGDKDRSLEVKNDLEKQSRIVDRLEEILTKNILDMKELEFVIKIFSKNQDKIEGILDDYNKNPEKYPKQPTTPQRIVRSISSSLSSLGRKDSTQSTSSLPESSSMSSLDSVRTESTISSEAELLNPAKHKKVKQSSGFFSRFKRNEPLKEATDIKYQVLSESGTLSVAPPKPPRSNSLNSIGTESTATVSDSDSQNFATVRRSNSSSSLTPRLTPVNLPKVPESASMNSFGSSMPTNPLGGELEQSSSKDKVGTAMEKDLEEFDSSTKAEFTHSSSSNHDGSDSGFNSPSSSSTRTILTGMKTQADLNLTNHTLCRQPSTNVVDQQFTQVKQSLETSV